MKDGEGRVSEKKSGSGRKKKSAFDIEAELLLYSQMVFVISQLHGKCTTLIRRRTRCTYDSLDPSEPISCSSK